MGVFLIVLGIIFLIAGGFTFLFTFLGERKKKIKVWVILILVSILLIIAGTVLVLVKKYGEKTTAKTVKYTALKPVPAKPKVITKSAWVARLSADREQVKDAVLIELNQAANDKIEVDTKSPFLITDTEIMFSYKKRGKLHEALLTRENPQLEHYYGIVDLSDNTQLELWLKEDGLEKYKGNARQIIKKGRKIIYGPLITASLRKEEVVVSLGQ